MTAPLIATTTKICRMNSPKVNHGLYRIRRIRSGFVLTLVETRQ